MNLRNICSIAVAAGVVFTAGCTSRAQLQRLEESNRSLQADLDSLKAESQKLKSSVQALQQDLAASRSQLATERADHSKLLTEKQKAENERDQLKIKLSRLNPDQTSLTPTRQELERVIVGKTKDEIIKVLGEPTVNYGTGGSYWKYSRVCRAATSDAPDEMIQLNFSGDVLRSISY